MRWSRLCTMLRYKHVFRLGVMTYLLLLLFLLVVWTSVHNRNLSGLNEVGEASPEASQHVHLRNEDILPRHDDILFTRNSPNNHLESPVFARRKYPTNHSHPVKMVPSIADIPAEQKSLTGPCSIVRMVEFFGQTLTLEGDPLCTWLADTTTMADDHFVLYNNKMALLYDVMVDPACRASGPKGGERMQDVWGQKAQAEYIDMKEGFFRLKCQSRPAVRFGSNDHLNQWISALRCDDNSTKGVTSERVEGLTIAIQRYEYVNLYHTMTDFYNAFLTMLMFNQHPDDVTILWVDAHPQGGLDDTWHFLFGQVIRAGCLPSPTRFSAMAWAAMGYNSPLNMHFAPVVSYLEEFRHFFLSRHGVDGGRKANCSSLTWMFIWRRDYAAHPRNKKGNISRKIYNEDELLSAVREGVHSGDKVRGVQLDSLPMTEQLQMISKTDVLLGMHGAGLSHTLFLPSYGGLLEFYPNYWPQANRHFRAMAAWRGLHYQTWQNQDSKNEKPNHKTYIPPKTVVKMVKEMRKNICG